MISENLHLINLKMIPIRCERRYKDINLEFGGKNYGKFLGNQLCLSPLSGYQASLKYDNGGFRGQTRDLGEKINLMEHHWEQNCSDGMYIMIKDALETRRNEVHTYDS